MSSVINLRAVRKRKARAEREQDAGRNRALHGITLEEKRRDRLQGEKAASFMDAHRLEKGRDDSAS